jgi:hypothetical protein
MPSAVLQAQKVYASLLGHMLKVKAPDGLLNVVRAQRSPAHQTQRQYVNMPGHALGVKAPDGKVYLKRSGGQQPTNSPAVSLHHTKHIHCDKCWLISCFYSTCSWLLPNTQKCYYHACCGHPLLGHSCPPCMKQ